MSLVTHVRIIFPLGFDPKHMIKTLWDESEECLCGAVLWHNTYWQDDIFTPSFAYGMEVHVGIERESERDLLGKVMPVPAQGLLRGEYLRWEPFKIGVQRGSGGWGWIVFKLRYDMDEGPETWSGEGDRVYTSGQAPEFYYAVERVNL
jgi:hypothetical protein